MIKKYMIPFILSVAFAHPAFAGVEKGSDVPTAPVSDFSRQVEIERMINRLGGYASLYGKTSKIAKNPLSKLIDQASKVISGEPVYFKESQLSAVREQRMTLEKIEQNLKAPKLNPEMKIKELEKQLMDSSAKVRSDAYQQLRERFNKHEADIKEWKSTRDRYVSFGRQARNDFERVYEFEKTLNGIHDSAAGAMLNAGTKNMFSWAVMDVNLLFTPEFGNRSSAADALVKAYDKNILGMENELKAHAQLRDWIKFYSLQEWLVSNSDNSSSKADRLLEKGKSLNAASKEKHDINKIIADAEITNEEVKAKARSLTEEAYRDMQPAGAHQQFMALLELAKIGAMAASAGSGSTTPKAGQAPPPSSSAPTYVPTGGAMLRTRPIEPFIPDGPSIELKAGDNRTRVPEPN